MKKIFLLLLPALLWSCTGVNNSEKQTSPVETESTISNPLQQEAERIMNQYKNFNSNELAKKSMIEEISKFGEYCIGSEAPFNGIKFKFEKVIENPQNGNYSALMSADISCYIAYDADENGLAPVGPGVEITALGVIPQELAITLDYGKEYSVSGVVKEFDIKDQFFITYPQDVFFGAFILDDMKITQLP